MERFLYENAMKSELLHWWFVGRRAVFSGVLDRLPAGNRDILDIGCGSGGNLPMLAAYGTIHACEYDAEARAFAKTRGFTNIEFGALPNELPFAGKNFDLITMFDVLEHVEDDTASLRAIHDRIKPGGYLLVSVPAFMLLWGHHDVINHHFRRYRKAQLNRLLEQAGFELVYSNYSNVALFPVAAVLRLWERFTGKKPAVSPGVKMSPKPVNLLLKTVFCAERYLSFIPFPFGISVVTLARKPR